LLVMVALMLASCARDKSYALTVTSKTQTTLIFFTDENMRDSEWSDLFDALHKALQREGRQIPALGQGAEFLRGDRIASGLEASQPISVYLHGDCSLVPMLRTSAMGALGWVRRVRGRIEPFIHVDCAQIALELGPFALGMNRNRRDMVMSEAMARVVLHEWVHVATQSPGHTKRGVEKAQFDAADLLVEDEEIQRHPQILRRRWNDL